MYYVMSFHIGLAFFQVSDCERLRRQNPKRSRSTPPSKAWMYSQSWKLHLRYVGESLKPTIRRIQIQPMSGVRTKINHNISSEIWDKNLTKILWISYWCIGTEHGTMLMVPDYPIRYWFRYHITATDCSLVGECAMPRYQEAVSLGWCLRYWYWYWYCSKWARECDWCMLLTVASEVPL